MRGASISRDTKFSTLGPNTIADRKTVTTWPDGLWAMPENHYLLTEIKNEVELERKEIHQNEDDAQEGRLMVRSRPERADRVVKHEIAVAARQDDVLIGLRQFGAKSRPSLRRRQSRGDRRCRAFLKVRTTILDRHARA